MYKGPFAYSGYNDCIRIHHSGEDFFPDMNIFDFAIGYDDFKLKGITSKGQIINRYFRWQYGYAWNLEDIKEKMKPLDSDKARQIYREKKEFCNFIYGHKSIGNKREYLYEKINEYKHVDSAGSYLNNMPDGHIVSFEKKIGVLRKYKFTIAAETLRYPGMTTEKIYDAFRANSIPIYFGNPFVANEINKESFVMWDGNTDSINKVIDKIIEIDENEELYIEMLKANKLVESNLIEMQYKKLEKFLLDIFEPEKKDIIQHVGLNDFSQRSAYEEYLCRKRG